MTWIRKRVLPNSSGRRFFGSKLIRVTLLGFTMMVLGCEQAVSEPPVTLQSPLSDEARGQALYRENNLADVFRSLPSEALTCQLTTFDTTREEYRPWYSMQAYLGLVSSKPELEVRPYAIADMDLYGFEVRDAGSYVEGRHYLFRRENAQFCYLRAYGGDLRTLRVNDLATIHYVQLDLDLYLEF